MSSNYHLSSLKPGESGTIAALAGERPFRRRLMELGLLPGTNVRLINRAPLGDPLEIEVRGCRLSIRAAEASQIDLRDDTNERPRRSLNVVG